MSLLFIKTPKFFFKFQKKISKIFDENFFAPHDFFIFYIMKEEINFLD